MVGIVLSLCLSAVAIGLMAKMYRCCCENKENDEINESQRQPADIIGDDDEDSINRRSVLSSTSGKTNMAAGRVDRRESEQWSGRLEWGRTRAGRSLRNRDDIRQQILDEEMQQTSMYEGYTNPSLSAHALDLSGSITSSDDYSQVTVVQPFCLPSTSYPRDSPDTQISSGSLNTPMHSIPKITLSGNHDTEGAACCSSAAGGNNAPIQAPSSGKSQLSTGYSRTQRTDDSQKGENQGLPRVDFH